MIQLSHQFQLQFLFPQDLVRKGVPHHFRAIVWQLLCNAQNMPIKDQYSELLKMTSPCERLIRRDIARTYPEHEFFKEKDSLGQEVLFNVMKVSLCLCWRRLCAVKLMRVHGRQKQGFGLNCSFRIETVGV